MGEAGGRIALPGPLSLPRKHRAQEKRPVAVILMLTVQAVLFVVVAGRMTDPDARRFAPALIATAAATIGPPLAVIAAVIGWSKPMTAVYPLFYIGPLLVLFLVGTSPPGAIVQDARRLLALCKGAMR